MESAGPECHGLCARNDNVRGQSAEGGRLKAPCRKLAGGNPALSSMERKKWKGPTAGVGPGNV